MGDRILVSLFFSFFVIWGVISVVNPTLAFRYQFGGSRNRKKNPNKNELLYYKKVGYCFILGGAILIISALLGVFTK